MLFLLEPGPGSHPEFLPHGPCCGASVRHNQFSCTLVLCHPVPCCPQETASSDEGITSPAGSSPHSEALWARSMQKPSRPLSCFHLLPRTCFQLPAMAPQICYPTSALSSTQ